MSNPFPSARHQAALSVPTGYRRRISITFSRGGDTVTLEPIGGQFTQDATRIGRWDGRLTFAGDDLLPYGPGDILTPFGTRAAVTLGIELLDGSVSTVPYGTYEISSARVGRTASQRTVEVGLADVSGAVERYRFESPFTVASGTDLGTMINQVVTNRIGINPGVGVVGSSLGASRVFGLDVSTAPWSETLDVLDGFSRTAWYDRVGHIQVGTLTPDPATAYPVPPLAAVSADFDTRPPNVVVARGESQDDTAPVQAVAMDTDPSSPTYAGTGPGTSPYGRVTLFYSSPLILTTGQAQSAADTILASQVGAGATYEMTLPFDPTISAGDVVSFRGTLFAVDAATVDLVSTTSIQIRELS